MTNTILHQLSQDDPFKHISESGKSTDLVLKNRGGHITFVEKPSGFLAGLKWFVVGLFTFRWIGYTDAYKVAKSREIEQILNALNTDVSAAIDDRTGLVGGLDTTGIDPAKVAANVKAVTAKLREKANKFSPDKPVVISFGAAPAAAALGTVQGEVDLVNAKATEISQTVNRLAPEAFRKKDEPTSSGFLGMFRAETANEKLWRQIDTLDAKLTTINRNLDQLSSADARRPALEHQANVLTYALRQLRLESTTYASDILAVRGDGTAANAGELSANLGTALQLDGGNAANNRDRFQAASRQQQINTLRILVADQNTNAGEKQKLQKLQILLEASVLIDKGLTGGRGVDAMADQLLREDVTSTGARLTEHPNSVVRTVQNVGSSIFSTFSDKGTLVGAGAYAAGRGLLQLYLTGSGADVATGALGALGSAYENGWGRVALEVALPLVAIAIGKRGVDKSGNGAPANGPAPALQAQINAIMA